MRPDLFGIDFPARSQRKHYCDTMPNKGQHSADGVKQKQRSKKDKAKRNFELHGKHSAKHVRAAAEAATKHPALPPVTRSASQSSISSAIGKMQVKAKSG